MNKQQIIDLVIQKARLRDWSTTKTCELLDKTLNKINLIADKELS